MTPTQIFKAVLRQFCESKTFNPSFFMATQKYDDPKASPPPPQNFYSSSEVVFVDPSGWLNIAAHLSRSSLIQVKGPLLTWIANILTEATKVISSFSSCDAW